MDDLRCGVSDASNKVEFFHAFSDHLRFENHSVLRSNKPEEYEKAIVYNELVANAVMVQAVNVLHTKVTRLASPMPPISALSSRVS